MGEEYSIKETCDTADKACAGKNQGSFEKYFFDMDNLESFCQYMKKLVLTEPYVSDRVNMKSEENTGN